MKAFVNKMSFKYLALCWLITLGIVDVHGDDCADVTKPCLLTAQKQTNSTEKCTVGQAYYDCLGNTLPAAQAAGICDATGILKQRFFAFVDLLNTLPGVIVVDVKGCDIKRPAYFTMTPCELNMLPCVLKPFQDFQVSSSQTLSEESCRSSLTNFKVCMETQTPQCQDRDLVAEVIRTVKEEYSRQFNCNATSINFLTIASSPSALPTTIGVTTIIAVTVAAVFVVVIAVTVIVICRLKCRPLCNRGLENCHRTSTHSAIYDDAASIASSVYDKIGSVPSVYDKNANSISAGTSDWSTVGLGALIYNPSLLSSHPSSGGQVSGHRESFLGPANYSSTSDSNTESGGTATNTTTASHSEIRTSIANPSPRSSGASLPSAATLYHLLLGNASSVSDTSSFASPRDSLSTVYASHSQGSTTYDSPRDSSSAYASLDDESSSYASPPVSVLSSRLSGSGSWSSENSSVVTDLRGPTLSTGSDVTVHLANPSDESSVSAAEGDSGGSYSSRTDLLP